MNVKDHVAGFADFIRKQGVVGVAVGFVLASAVAKMVTALVTDQSSHRAPLRPY